MLLNAIHAVNEKGRIGIRSKMNEQKKSILIEIQDNGHGIPQGKLKKIFEPFYTTKAHGTGLGLAVSYGIIKNHGGVIKVDSILHQYTKMIIELPTSGI